MKQSAKGKATKKNLKVKDLALKSNAAKTVKGGIIGPCYRPKK